jgi:NhaP-type Na+/H+ or K+/H+ antiporter
VAYIGWFGPRGLASIVLGLMVVEEHVPGVEPLGRVVAITVGRSVLLREGTAVPPAPVRRRLASVDEPAATPAERQAPVDRQ